MAQAEKTKLGACFHYFENDLGWSATPAIHGILCKRRAKVTLPDLFKDGDIILGGIFTMHLDRNHDSNTFTSTPKSTACKSFDFESFRLAQTMIFAIEEINQNKNLLPEITLGYQIHDDCSSPSIASKAALALINGEEESVEYSECTGSSNVAAIVGCGVSTNSIVTARTVGYFGIPLISYYSTCACLSDKKEYPTFFRTIPGDQYQSRILAELVRTFGWTWIGTIRSNTDYGNFGMQGFVEHVETFGVCIAYSESFYRTDAQEKISKIVQVIKQASTNVVVAFVHRGDMRVLLKEIWRQNVTGIQWIGSEAWVTGKLLPPEERANYLTGTIGPITRRTEIADLRDYLHGVHPSNFPASILVTEFWEALFACSFTTDNSTNLGNSPVQVRKCTGNEQMEGIENNYLPAKMDGSSFHVYTAVYSIAHALHDLFTCVEGNGPFLNKTCANISNFEARQLLHYIRNVNFNVKSGEAVYFDGNGDPVPRYDFVNLQKNLKGVIDIIDIGYYDGSAPPGREVTLNVEDIMWNSTGCIGCPAEYWSNQAKTECVFKKIEFLSFGEALGFVLAALNLLGVCFSLATAVIFYRYRETPIVKANNSELSFLLLFALLLCFICSLAFIGEPSGWSCMLRRTAFGVVFVLCISCVLGKTILVVIAFRATLPNSSMMNWFEPAQQRLGVLILTLLQGLVCAVWLGVSPPYPHKNMNHYRDIIILECDVGSMAAFCIVSAYIALLSIVCLVLAFFARKLPDNFNDAKYITFSMLIFCAVWITFIPAYVSSPGKYTAAVEVFAIWASSFGLLFCIFAPKCYIILLKPENNTKKHMMTKGTSL
ncbi:extracellular calcium-sensing receptor-like [Hemitrygon akajei]|uniref:extracellular calcium-sensing receptor-like n=1 Tax=Hemitrygon akajei TaxID=2704970 RepID=UPI003BF9E240